jgi:hypothetical protein
MRSSRQLGSSEILYSIVMWMQMMETPLIRCAHNGHFQTVKFLVEQGADVNAIDLVQAHCQHSRASTTKQKEE